MIVKRGCVWMTWLATGWLALGCARGAALRGRADGLADLAAQASDRGARRCAPRQLAMAAAHIDFARVELQQGDYDRAEQHLNIADPNAHASLALSPAEHCSDADRDRDGILDREDRCIDQPEDRDDHDDFDGCPEADDADNDGLMDNDDRCPFAAEDRDDFEDADGCPDTDNDHDGVPDASDRCPTDAEDRDGYEDTDGCPENDNDRDGVVDAADRCPLVPGPAPTGCPAPPMVELTDNAIVIRQQVFFENNRAVIRPNSFELLGQVAEIMRTHSEVSIEVQGHTDSRGPDARNLLLSQQRAEAVLRFLVDHGVPATRLRARGYGETSPIESNATTNGRASNRRVEFVRTP